MKTAQIVMGLGQLVEKIHATTSTKPWNTLSRTEFIRTIERVIPLVHQTVGQLEAAHQAGIDAGLPETDELGEALHEFQKLEELLTKNLDMEARKKSLGEAANRFDTGESPDVYTAVEHKVLNSLLKMRFLLERLGISAKKHGLPAGEHKATAQNVLTLLREKETELQSVRFKYEALRKQALVGAAEEETMTSELVSLAHTEEELARQSVLLEEQQKKIANHLAPLVALLAEMNQHLDRHAHLAREQSVTQKSVLKKIAKERDYAQRVLLDIEHETLQLRNRYSSELLNLHEHKAATQKQTEDKFTRHHETLSRNLAKQNELIAHLQKMLDERENRIAKLESDLTHTRLALATHQKHARIKKNLGQSKKKKKK